MVQLTVAKFGKPNIASGRVFGTVLGVVFQMLLMASVSAQSIRDADASFAYIKSTLDTFNGSGRLVKNPGIDGADLEAFIEVLNDFSFLKNREFF